MIWLLDENLSFRLSKLLKDAGIECQHISDVGLKNQSDLEIFMFARTNNHVLLTKDDDFQDLSMLYGRPPLIVKLEIGNMDNASTAAVLIRDKDEIGYAYSSQSYQILRIYSLRSVH